MHVNAPGALYLLPVPISETDINWSMPLEVINQIPKIQLFIVENAKTARGFAKKMHPAIDFTKIQFYELNKHNINSQTVEIKQLLTQYEFVGLMSESGLPCVADPGNHVVRIAHEIGITVKPFTGPSSIMLALAASGLDGQRFKFNGYLPSKPEERKEAIRQLERYCNEATQLFIEAPYRNEKMLADLVSTLSPGKRLLVASNITGPEERIICRQVSWWKKNTVLIGKVPCLFGIGV